MRIMTEILDENYFDQFGQLKITDAGTGFLYVDLDKWQAELYRIERSENAGCVLIAIICICILFFPPFTVEFFPFACLIALGGFLYKRISGWRFVNLQQHGYYHYEIYTDRAVRYTDRKYEKFVFAEAQSIKFKDYGILIIKEKNGRNFWLNFLNPRFILIPNQVQGYEQIAKHIRNKIG